MERTRVFAEASLVYAVVFGILLLGRLDTLSIWYPLNPDEAQAAANALRLLRDPMPWRSVNGGSNGPINFYVLMVPFAFGQPISFYWVRVIGLAFVAGSFLCMYLAALRFVSRPIAGVLLAFPTLFYALTTQQEFLHYHSEIVPVFLICVAVLLGIRVYERYSFFGAFGLANIGVLIAFAKLQAVLFSVGIQFAAVVALFIAAARRGRPILLTFAVNLFVTYLPLLLVATLLVVTNTWGDFFADYIAAGKGYVRPMFDARHFYWFVFEGGKEYVRFAAFATALAVAGFLWLAFGWCRGLFTGSPMHPTRSTNILIVAVAILYAMSWWTISRPGREFPHYLYFGVLPAFAGMLVPFAFARRDGKSGGLVAQGITAVIACVVLVAYVSDLRGTRLATNAKQWVQGSLSVPGRLRSGLFPHGSTWLSWVLPSDASLFVWGWAAEWYVLANGHPATRDTVAVGLTSDVRVRHRTFRELAASDPLVVIDAVAPGSFRFTDRMVYGIETDPEFSKWVREKYVLINPGAVTYECPRMYVKSRYFTDRSRQLVDFKRVQLDSSAAVAIGDGNLLRLSDRSTFERCRDFWSYPTSATPVISMSFTPTSLQRVSILNSYGQSRDGATRSLRVSFYAGGELSFGTQVALDEYPRWTNIDVPTARKIDELRLSDLTSDGPEVALNEVIIFARQ